MAAIVDPIDSNSARLDGKSSSRRYSVCAHVDPIKSDNFFTNMHHGDASVMEDTDSHAAFSAASPRSEMLKSLFSDMPPRPDQLSVYSCGDSIGLVTKKHVWAFVKTSPKFFSLSGFQMLQSGMTTNSFQNSGTAYSNSASSLFDPFSTKPFRLASSEQLEVLLLRMTQKTMFSGPQPRIPQKSHSTWARFPLHSGPCLVLRWYPDSLRPKKRGVTLWNLLPHQHHEERDISSSAALTILGHAARLSSTFSASVKVIDPDVNGRNLSNHHLDQSARLMPLPQVGDICEAQYQGRRNRSSWGYRGVQITAVNVLDADMYEYTYDLQYPDGDSEAGGVSLSICAFMAAY